MKSTLMLTSANLRRNKGQAVSLLMFVLLAVMFMNIGLVLFINFGSFFDKRAEELHAPHLTILQENDITTKEQVTWLKNNSTITEIEEQSVITAMGDYYMNGAKSVGYLVLANANAKQLMNPPTLIGESLPLSDNSIYVPYLMTAAGGYQLGDPYKMTISGTNLEFTIAGFTEEITFGSAMDTKYRFYISSETYKTLFKTLKNNQCTLFSIRTIENTRSMQVNLDYTKQFFYSEGVDESSSAFLHSIDYANSVKQARTFIPMVMAMLVIAFAIIILAVCLLVLRFSIDNNIEQSMVNIGVLKAIGYKNSQIVTAIIFQFSVIAFVGGVFGIGISQVLLLPLSKILEAQSALIWNPPFDLRWAVISIFVVLLAILLASFLSAKRIYRLYPLVALRGGVETHSFQKNRIPLDRTRGSLPFLMGMKQMTQNVKQSLMIVLMIAAMAFASVSSISLYYNVGVETNAFESLIAGERPDAALMNEKNDTEAIMSRLQERDEVRKVFEYQHINLLVDDITSVAVVTRDFLQLEGDMLFDGRYPKYENEIAISANLAGVLGKEIGDTVEVKQGSNARKFLITGVIQMLNGNGLNIAMPYEALLTIQEDYLFNQIYIYLNEGTNATTFLESIKKQEGDSIFNTIEIKELAKAQLGQFGSIFAVIATVILAITVFIIILVLYMVIRTMILRKKREFGIQKAVGFTTLQLMNQIALQYTPLIFFGVAIGGVGGYFGFNQLFGVLTKGMGVIKTEFPIPLDWTIGTCLALTLLAYFVSLFVSSRIRKVSPYALVSD